MKSSMFFLVLFLFGITATFSQTKLMSSDEMLKNEIQQLTQVLSLTTDQINEITPILKTSIDKLYASNVAYVDSVYRTGRAKMLTERKNIIAEQDTKLKAILNDSQDLKLDNLRKQQELEVRKQQAKQR